MSRKNIPGWLIVPGILGLGAVFFIVGYWPDRSLMDGVLSVLAGIASLTFWFLLDGMACSDERRSEESNKNKFGLL